MIKPDEQALWDALAAGEQPRTAGPRLGIPPKRVWYLCEKWSRRRIYGYGVSCDLGWLETRQGWWLRRRADGMLQYHPYTKVAQLSGPWGWLECPNCFQPRLAGEDCEWCGSDDPADVVTAATSRNTELSNQGVQTN